MKNFKICNLLETYEARTSSEFGQIFVQLEDYAFPSQGWTDFGTQIVFWWMQEIVELFSGEKNVASCTFMDGNYRFDIEATTSYRVWNIYFVRERNGSNELLNQGEVDSKQVSQEVLRAVDEVQRRFKEKNNLAAVARVETLKEKFALEYKRYMDFN